MASITEILTLVVIIVGILILPKLLRPQEKNQSKKPLSINSISIPVRFGIVLSILIPIISAIFYRPWDQGLVMFIFTGIVPLILGWGLFWVFSGFKKTESK